MFPISKDQLDGQIKILVSSVGTILSAFGIVNYEKVGAVIGAVLTAVGPIAYIYVAVTLFFKMSRASVMASAATAVAPGVPAPTIVLPKEEALLADKLPGNVTAAP